MIDHEEMRRRTEDIIRGRSPIALRRVLFNQAEFYNQGAIASLERLSATQNAGLGAPAIMCQSFAVEMLLKFFILAPYPNVMRYAELKPLRIDLRGHRYSQLLDQIEPAHQEAIARTFTSRTGKDCSPFTFRDRLIQTGDDPFVAWRYVYEKDGIQHLDLELFAQLLDSLGTCAQSELETDAKK